MEISFNHKDGNLKCSICNKPLSVLPILHSNILGNICGRCHDKALECEVTQDCKLERQKIYENLLKYLMFPCAYQVFGCDTKLKWDKVVDHEDQCVWKNIACPFSGGNFQKQCNWLDEHTALVAHLKRDHKEFCHDLPQLSFNRDFQSSIIFCEVEGYLVLIIWDYKRDLNKYYCCIAVDANLNDCSNYKYQIEIFSKEWDDPVVMRRCQVEALYGNTVARPDNSVEIDINNIKHLFEKSNEINVKFTLVRKNDQNKDNKKLTANFSVNRTEEIEINEELLPDLECPVCVEFMMPPIYICLAGHNVCSNCHAKVRMCPICRGEMLGGRNYTLEKLTATINYPCFNRIRGCGFVGLIVKVKEHEKNCLLTERECFVANCAWQGANVELKSHVEESHKILELNELHTHLLERKIEHYILQFDNKLFFLRIKFDMNQPFEYIVQCYGGGETEYKYELQIIGSPLVDIKVTLCHQCEPLPYSTLKETFNNFTGISIPFSLLRQFLTHFHQLQFKISIKKMNG